MYDKLLATFKQRIADRSHKIANYKRLYADRMDLYPNNLDAQRREACITDGGLCYATHLVKWNAHQT